MQIEIKVDPGCGEPRIVIVTDRITDEINALVKKLGQDPPQLLAGMQGDLLKILDQHDIFRLYVANGKVFAETEDGAYQLRLRLYELEGRLDQNDFVRISNSEIVNLDRVTALDLSLAGTIRMTLDHSVSTYVSRRYVKKIKEALGLRKER